MPPGAEGLDGPDVLRACNAVDLERQLQWRVRRGRDPGVIRTRPWSDRNKLSSHSRRKFLEALKLHPQDRVAARIVARIDELFSVDAEARAAQLDHSARQALRLERARPLLDLLKPQIVSFRRSCVTRGRLQKR